MYEEVSNANEKNEELRVEQQLLNILSELIQTVSAIGLKSYTSEKSGKIYKPFWIVKFTCGTFEFRPIGVI